MWSIIAGVMALAAMWVPMYARAQITSTTVVDVPISGITPAESTITPTPTASFGTMTVECWRTTLLAGSSARFAVDTAAASTVSGAVCWEVFSLNGGIASVPVTPGPDFEPLSLQSSMSAAAAASDNTVSPSSSSVSSNNNLSVVLPVALISSIVGVVVLIFTMIYLLRWRARRQTQGSRARRWVERNSVAISESWAMKQTTPANKPEGV